MFYNHLKHLINKTSRNIILRNVFVQKKTFSTNKNKDYDYLSITNNHEINYLYEEIEILKHQIYMLKNKIKVSDINTNNQFGYMSNDYYILQDKYEYLDNKLNNIERLLENLLLSVK